jgi:hypothetical protein
VDMGERRKSVGETLVVGELVVVSVDLWTIATCVCI